MGVVGWGREQAGGEGRGAGEGRMRAKQVCH